MLWKPRAVSCVSSTGALNPAPMMRPTPLAADTDTAAVPTPTFSAVLSCDGPFFSGMDGGAEAGCCCCWSGVRGWGEEDEERAEGGGVGMAADEGVKWFCLICL